MVMSGSTNVPMVMHARLHLRGEIDSRHNAQDLRCANKSRGRGVAVGPCTERHESTNGLLGLYYSVSTLELHDSQVKSENNRCCGNRSVRLWHAKTHKFVWS